MIGNTGMNIDYITQAGVNFCMHRLRVGGFAQQSSYKSTSVMNRSVPIRSETLTHSLK